MKSIGVRELRQDASTYLRLVEAGETVQVTDHGRPVALLTPIPKNESTYERLLREGRIIPAKNPGFDILDIKPTPPKPGVPLPSVLLERDRYGDDA
jgi:prevent-host-death family protein